jgi:predicted ArsR family transcriptional regulator
VVDLPNGNGDDLLTQPTRRRLFALLGELGGTASTDVLAERLAMHPNGVRNHLRRMCDAGLLIHRRVAGPRGRPRDEWAISPGARPGGVRPQANGALARWLARAIPATAPRVAEVEATGRDIGRELAPAAAPPRQALADLMTALGFQPELEHHDRRLGCTLRNCPYRDSVRENQQVICGLHRGLVLGLLDRVAPDATLERFVSHDPYEAGCEVEIANLPPAPGDGAAPAGVPAA